MSLILAHIGGIPVEEALACVVATGISYRIVGLYVREQPALQRFRRAQRDRLEAARTVDSASPRLWRNW